MRTAFTHLYMKGYKRYSSDNLFSIALLLDERQCARSATSCARSVVQARHGHPHCYIEYGYFCTVGTVFTRL